MFRFEKINKISKLLNLSNLYNSNNKRLFSNFRHKIEYSITQRKEQNLEPEILNYDEVKDLILEIKKTNFNDKDSLFLIHQLQHRVLPGVDPSSQLKANYLFNIASNLEYPDLITPQHAIKMLGSMQGGYSIEALINLLDSDYAEEASDELKNNILIFDYFYSIEEKYKNGNKFAKKIIESWANAEWFKNKPNIKDKITLNCFRVKGEINTDDLSPAQDAWSRPDIPLHAQSMFKVPRDDIVPDLPYEIGPMKLIEDLKKDKYPVAFVGDVVGTGSSRKSATNSLLWHFGNNIPFVPNKRFGGFCFGEKIAPIFFNTMEDSGALPIEMPVNDIKMGQIIDVYPYEGITKDHKTGKEICKWKIKSPVLLDSVRAGGRINLIIGKSLTNKSQKALKKYYTNIFVPNEIINDNNKGYTLAQKIVGKACGIYGVSPGSYCEPKITSVGSQDTTGPMTRNELKDLACLGFSADLVMQSFCHTAAYPKPIDLVTHNTLPEFINNRGGISLKPGDGIIHSWLNRMLLPDTVGTGGDSHTRFPIGISFPGGSGVVAFAAATGVMPLDMPESVLVKFKGEMQNGITLRDIVHSIPYFARKRGFLSLDKKNKVNIFNGRILEIEGLPNLTCEQAFELSDASAERSAAGCTIKLNKEPVIEYLESNISLLKWMIKEGYNDKKSIKRRINEMENWLKNPVLLEADKNAEYKEIIEIDLNEITEPILCAPNDPDAAVLLSEVENEKIDEVFIGSCMTNIGHFRAAGRLLESYYQNNTKQLKTKLWMAPPTKMDEKKLRDEGFYQIYDNVGVRTEMPGCSLCMGNQARVEDKATVLSTSTRNFPNRLGKGANVYLASAELSAITGIEGKIPNKEKYMDYFKNLQDKQDEIFKYMNFNKLDEYSINN